MPVGPKLACLRAGLIRMRTMGQLQRTMSIAFGAFHLSRSCAEICE